MLTVIAAMEQELAGVRRALSAQETMPVELRTIGIGKERAQSNVKRLIASRDASDGDSLLLLGFAGGLDPTLKSGDLLLPTCFYDESGSISAADSDMWHQARLVALEAGLTVTQGNSLTVDQLIATPEGKRELYRQHQVGIVNLEDYWVAEVAADAGVPFLSVRSVFDPVSQELPPYVLGLAGGQVEAILRTATRPWRVPTLLALARMRNLAQASLTRFGLAYIKHELSATRRQPAAI